ncbi:DMT family transporter [Polycladidibacter hongkongensis]|uniref:DMT family transporter n=1 Tax=Polycladidibacter hongkongensis TaxID=1647556 RepID=UPI00082FA424|nr:DMT family transporter [Pseudovibrio hongkongensis]
MQEFKIPHSRRQALLGTLALLVSTTMFASLPLFGAVGAQQGVGPAMASLLRFGLPALLLGFLLPVALGKGRGGRVYVGFGMLTGAGVWGYLYASTHLSLFTVLPLYFSWPLFLFFLRWFTGRHRASKALPAAAALLSLLGVVLCALQAQEHGTGEALPALAAGLIGPISYAVLSSQKELPVPYLSGVSVAACVFLGGTIASAALLFASGEAIALPQRNMGWLAVFGVMLLSGLVPQLLFTVGTHATPKHLLEHACLFELLGAFLLAVLFLEDWPKRLDGLGLICCAAALALSRERAKPQA